MPRPLHHLRSIDRTTYLLVGWSLLIAVVVYSNVFQAGVLSKQFGAIIAYSTTAAYLIYFVIGCLRGFTLIPVTYLIILGLLFFPPVPLYFLTITSILISSISVYYFAEQLGIAAHLRKRYPERIARVTKVLEKNEVPIIIAWSFAPFLPTDIICYICGALEVNIRKFAIAVFVGESLACALYIFGGHALLGHLQLI